MTSTDPRIVIALESGGPAPSGYLEIAGEEDQPFAGWLNLLAVLGETIDRYGAPGADGGPESARPA
jgi:hypothetical protein